MHIIIDTREQTPWAFEPYIETSVGTLKQGDYALDGDEAFSIERKSLDDFLGTIASGWDRFCRELGRMDEAGYPIKVIVVEGDYATCTFREDPIGELVPPQHRHWMLTPQFVESRIAELTIKGAAVLFAANAHLAAGLAVAVFKHRKIQLLNQNEANQNRDTVNS